MASLDNKIAIVDANGGYFAAEPLDAPAHERGVTHALASRRSLWQFINPKFSRPYSGAMADTPLFDLLAPGLSLAQAAVRTRFMVFFGAENSPQLTKALARDDSVVLVFEPEPDRMDTFLEQVANPDMARGKRFVFSGDINTFRRPLSRLLPQDLFDAGFPAFFQQKNWPEAYVEWAEEIMEQLEFLYFRHRVYPVISQPNQRGLPLRPMQRGLFFDQQKHLYENLGRVHEAVDLRALRKAYSGRDAVLVAAGPDLVEKLDFIEQASSRAVVIAVNSALKPLLAAGIEPHITLINDAGLVAEPSLTDVERLESTLLVAHQYSYTGKDSFRNLSFFGGQLKELFGPTPTFRYYGSVLTLAFAVARFLGCSRTVFMGAHLASRNPWGLDYAPGTTQGPGKRLEKPLTHAFPQLYPVRTSHGQELYTTPNFRDVSLWLRDEIRSAASPSGAGLICVNTSQDSLLSGPNIIYDPEPDVLGRSDMHELHAQAVAKAREDTPGNRAEAARFLNQEQERWLGVEREATNLLDRNNREHDLEGVLQTGQQLVQRFDDSGVSYLVQRFSEFSNPHFHAAFLTGKTNEKRAQGLEYFLNHVARMADYFAGLAHEQGKKLGPA